MSTAGLIECLSPGRWGRLTGGLSICTSVHVINLWTVTKKKTYLQSLEHQQAYQAGFFCWQQFQCVSGLDFCCLSWCTHLFCCCSCWQWPHWWPPHCGVHYRVSTLGMILGNTGCPRVGGVVTWGLTTIVGDGGHKVSTLPRCCGLHVDLGLAFVPITLILIAIFLVLVIPSQLSLFLWFLSSLRSSLWF